MNTQFSGKYELLDQIAEEFAQRLRKGERPAVQEYTQRSPSWRPTSGNCSRPWLKSRRLRPTQGFPRRLCDRSATIACCENLAAAAWAWSTRRSNRRSAGAWRSKCSRFTPVATPRPGSIQTRGPLGSRVASHEHRSRLRGRPDRRLVLLRHAVHSGPRPRSGRRGAARLRTASRRARPRSDQI